jgi:short-subunit dehydrogenase
MSKTQSNGTALITGASTGIGSVYADRLARRGYDLILVARNEEKLTALSTRLKNETQRSVTVLCADLIKKADLIKVEATLRGDPHINVFVNNAGVAAVKPLVDADIDKMEEMIDLNVTAFTRLIYAVAPPFVARGTGTIINIGSVVGISPEVLNGVYGATKAYVLALTHSLQRRQRHPRSGGAPVRHRNRCLGDCRSSLLQSAARDRDVDGRPSRCSAERARPRRTGYDSTTPGWR